MVKKDLPKVVGKPKLFDCFLIIYVMGLILFFIFSSLCFTAIVIILPMGRKGLHLLGGWTRICEYNYNLKVCAFNVGGKEKSGVSGMLVHDTLEVLLVIGL